MGNDCGCYVASKTSAGIECSLSQRARGRDVMTRIYWQKNTNSIHYGGARMNMSKALGYIPSQDSLFTGQASLGFCFDESAKDTSVNALIKQMPNHIYHDDEGITFGEMFATTCNESPASADIYCKALGMLMELNEVEVISSDGGNVGWRTGFMILI